MMKEGASRTEDATDSSFTETTLVEAASTCKEGISKKESSTKNEIKKEKKEKKKKSKSKKGIVDESEASEAKEKKKSKKDIVDDSEVLDVIHSSSRKKKKSKKDKKEEVIIDNEALELEPALVSTVRQSSMVDPVSKKST